jgi:hypothetical protein
MLAVRAAASVCLATLAALTSCGPSEPARSAEAPEGTRSAKIVNATIVANGCQKLGDASARLAERAMYDLVEGCAAVPGGTARFHATLQPGGRIEIVAGPGQPEVIPICVVKHSLLHKVRLSEPCGLDVKLEETTLAVTRDAGTR